MALLRAVSRPALRAIAVSSLVARSDLPVWDALVDRELWTALPGQPSRLLKALSKRERQVAFEFLLPQLQATETADSAAKLLGRHRDLRWLVPILASEAPLEVIIEVLSELRVPSVVNALIDALKHPNSRIRANAALCLADRHEPKVLDALVRVLDDPHRRVRTAAVESLGKLGDRRALPALGEIVVHRPIGNPEFALAFVTWVRLVGEPAIKPLSDFVFGRTQNQDHRLRQLAVRALGATRSHRGVELLRQVIEEGKVGMVDAAILGLGQSGRPEAIDTLRLLLHGRWGRAATNALVELRIPQATEVLRAQADRYRDQGDTTEEAMTRQALSKLGDEPADALW